LTSTAAGSGRPLSAAGRADMNLTVAPAPGEFASGGVRRRNLRHLAPGACFVRAVSGKLSAASCQKVIVTR